MRRVALLAAVAAAALLAGGCGGGAEPSAPAGPGSEPATTAERPEPDPDDDY